MKSLRHFFVIFLLCVSPILAEGDKEITAPSLEIKIEKVPELKAFLNDYETKIRNEFQKDFNETNSALYVSAIGRYEKCLGAFITF